MSRTLADREVSNDPHGEDDDHDHQDVIKVIRKWEAVVGKREAQKWTSPHGCWMFVVDEGMEGRLVCPGRSLSYKLAGEP